MEKNGAMVRLWKPRFLSETHRIVIARESIKAGDNVLVVPESELITLAIA
jgi:hypothetical protein